MGKKILIMGDICPDNNYRRYFDQGTAGLSADIIGEIKSADIVIANLECPATDCNKPISKCGPNLKAKPEDITVLKDIGVTTLSLANNHVLDYGTHGVLDTIKGCEKNGVDMFGVGVNVSDAKKALIVDMNHIKLGLIAFAEKEFNLASVNEPGANHFDVYESFDEIIELKKSVDYVIAFYHGGIEHYVYPSPLLQKKCRKMIESGADLVLCQHSHCIGTFEKYQKGAVLYGQGNSIFGYRAGDDNWNEGLLLNLDTDDMDDIHFRLINATEEGIIFAERKREADRISKMFKQSECLGDATRISEEWKKFVKTKQALYYPLLYGKNRIFNKFNRLLKNKLVSFIFSSRAQMTTMNLIRCEAHNEVVTTMLEEKIYGKR